MKSIALTILVCLAMSLYSNAQNNELQKKEVNTGNTSFFYHVSPEKSDAVVLLFHDWFGVTDLSYEMADRLIEKGIDVIIMDLYKGRSATTNQEAGGLMNSIDQANMWEYIDTVLKKAGKNHEQIFVWGFSLGTIPASQTAIKNNEIVDGLILFYGNVTQDKEQIAKITFPSLMVMGAKDNPQGAIGYYENVTKAGGQARLFIYPEARHAFAQKLFNAGGNYDEKAKEASLEVAFRFLSELTEK
ncbi:dienelactone hydrolase family protein [Ekhidna sp. To15]|uniref:dienelactone hydrolase family protein n=1 Tax=Ekhidna sp. To15 TaxID=3395267 RepID=UPI003F51E156